MRHHRPHPRLHAKGNEAETVQILGDSVVSKPMPVILCDEDDVAGNHGANYRSVSPEQTISAGPRGFPRREAERLLYALFEDAIIHAWFPSPMTLQSMR